MQSNPMLEYVPDDDWYLYDHLGTPLALSDEQGAVVAEWVRDPFGNIVSKSGAVEDNHVFPGQFWDADANLAYNWNRWYAPGTGRYVEVDPLIDKLLKGRLPSILIPQFARVPDKLRAYPYARNNPLRYLDPKGLSYRSSTPLNPPQSQRPSEKECREFTDFLEIGWGVICFIEIDQETNNCSSCDGFIRIDYTMHCDNSVEAHEPDEYKSSLYCNCD